MGCGVNGVNMINALFPVKKGPNSGPGPAQTPHQNMVAKTVKGKQEKVKCAQ